MNSTKQHCDFLSDRVEMMVTTQEHKLLETLRNLEYGEVQVFIKGYTIVRMEEKKSIKM